MEELIKFITTEQSKRTEAFMFTWRILMAVLLTNLKLNKMNFYFINQEIKFNTFIDFLFSNQFYYASIWYLIFVFLFFWVFRIGYIFVLIISYLFAILLKKNLKESFLIDYLSLFRIIKKNVEKGWLIRNRNNFELLQIMCEIMDNHTMIINKLLTYSSVLLSTYCWYDEIHKFVITPFYIDKILFVLLIVCVLGIFYVNISVYSFKDKLTEFMLEYKKKGFYDDFQ